MTDPKTRQITQRKYRSQMSDQICYAVLCVFSYIAAGLEQRKRLHQGRDGTDCKESASSRTANPTK